MDANAIAKHAINLAASRHVKRWHIVNVKPQSVAEHTYLVWVIGMALFDVGFKGHSSTERSDFAEFLLTHDADEAIVGDIPTPVKAVLCELYPSALREASAVLSGEVGRSAYVNRQGHWTWALYKIADLAEACLYLMDNGAPAHVLRQIRSDFAKAELNLRQYEEHLDIANIERLLARFLGQDV